jgi:hypothetical protein
VIADERGHRDEERDREQQDAEDGEETAAPARSLSYPLDP